MSDEVPWDDVTVVVLRSQLHVGRAADGRLFYMSYDMSTANPQGAVCNALQTDGTLCRLPREHWTDSNIGHVAFDPLLVIESGVYVEAIGPAVE